MSLFDTSPEKREGLRTYEQGTEKKLRMPDLIDLLSLPGLRSSHIFERASIKKKRNTTRRGDPQCRRGSKTVSMGDELRFWYSLKR